MSLAVKQTYVILYSLLKRRHQKVKFDFIRDNTTCIIALEIREPRRNIVSRLLTCITKHLRVREGKRGNEEGEEGGERKREEAREKSTKML